MLRLKKIIEKEKISVLKIVKKTSISSLSFYSKINKKADFTIIELEKINAVFGNKYDIEEFLIDDPE